MKLMIFISIIQPNIKQDLKWEKEFQNDHINNLLDLSKIDKSSSRYITRLVIWPETSYPEFILEIKRN